MTYAPHIGSDYSKTRFLILGESAYSGRDTATRKMIHPERMRKYPSWVVHNGVVNFVGRKSDFASRITQALTGQRQPDEQMRQKAWDQCAYTLYVQENVGISPRGQPNRPTTAMYRSAETPFLSMLEKMKPRRVLVVGREMWKNMPKGDKRRGKYIRAYKLASGRLGSVPT